MTQLGLPPSIDPWNGKGLKGKVSPPGIEPRASGLSHQCFPTDLQCSAQQQPPYFLALISFTWSDCWVIQSYCCVRSWWLERKSGAVALAVSKVYGWWQPRLSRSLTWSLSVLGPQGVPSIGLLHGCDYAYDFSHQLTHTAITLYLSTYTITMAMQNCWIQELGYNCNKRPSLVYSYNRLNTRPT